MHTTAHGTSCTIVEHTVAGVRVSASWIAPPGIGETLLTILDKDNVAALDHQATRLLRDHLNTLLDHWDEQARAAKA